MVATSTTAPIATTMSNDGLCALLFACVFAGERSSRSAATVTGATLSIDIGASTTGPIDVRVTMSCGRIAASCALTVLDVSATITGRDSVRSGEASITSLTAVLPSRGATGSTVYGAETEASVPSLSDGYEGCEGCAADETCVAMTFSLATAPGGAEDNRGAGG